MSPHSIEVTWDPPVADVDDVTGYVISYDGVESFADDGSVSVSRSTNRATINGLEEFVRYDITVQAVYSTFNVPSSSVRVMTLSDGKLYITAFFDTVDVFHSVWSSHKIHSVLNIIQFSLVVCV